MSALSPCGYSQGSADSRDDMSMSPPLSVTLSPKSMNNLLNMSHDEQVSHGIIPMSDPSVPYLQIVEQPVDKFRFRYKSEMLGTHGSLTGRLSEKNRKKSYPTVQLCNYEGAAMVRCSLYTAQQDVKLRTPHAHRLVVKVSNKDQDEPHEMQVDEINGYEAVFQGMGIIHTAKKHIQDELINKHKARLLHERRFNNNNINRGELTAMELAQLKKEVALEAKNMNLNVVTLCFEAFALLPNQQLGIQLGRSVFSTSINNMKSALTGELKICRIDRSTSSCRGNEEVFMLVEKVGKKNIRVKVYEVDDDDNEIWCDYGKFSELDVHHQFAIVFRTPPYRDCNIQECVNVLIQLYRPTDGDCSEPIRFSYKPDAAARNLKRRRTTSTTQDKDVKAMFNGDDSNDLLPLTQMMRNVTTVPDTQHLLLNGWNPMLPQTNEPQTADFEQLSSLPSIEAVLNADGQLPSAEFTDFVVNFPSGDYFGTSWSSMDLATDGATRRLRPITNADAALAAVSQPVEKRQVAEPSANQPPDGYEFHLSETDGSILLRSVEATTDCETVQDTTVADCKTPVGKDATVPTKTPYIKVRTDIMADKRTEAKASNVEFVTDKQTEAKASNVEFVTDKQTETKASDVEFVTDNQTEAKASDVEFVTDKQTERQKQQDKRLPAKNPTTSEPSSGGRQKMADEETMTVEGDRQAMVTRVLMTLKQMLLPDTRETPQEKANTVRDLFNAEKTDDGDSALHVAVNHDKRDYANVMLNALCTGQPCFGQHGSLKDVLDLRNDKDETALHLAVLRSRPMTVQALLVGGANPNLSDAEGEFPIHLAARHCHRECLAQLLDTRNYRHTSKMLHLNVKNGQGWTAMHLSALRGDLASLCLLTAAGADVNQLDRSGGRTVLHLAAEEQDLAIARHLLRHTDIDIDRQNRAGNTALHVAVVVGDNGNKQLCDMLLRARADPLVANFNTEPREPCADVRVKDEPQDPADETTHLTPVDLATNNQEILAMLQSSMGTPTQGSARDDVLEVKKEEEDEEVSFQAAISDQMFDPATLNNLCSMLDRDAIWERLARLLDYEFLVTSLRSADVASPAKALLNYTELKGQVSVHKIRDLLTVLDEQKAVEMIDLMLAKRFV